MSIQKALLIGISVLLLLLSLSQLATLWWFQQQLQQELTTQSGQLSRIVLARTAENISRIKPPEAASTSAVATKAKAIVQVEEGIKVIQLSDNTLPAEMQQQLDKTLKELREQSPTAGNWVQKFQLEQKGSSQILIQNYLKNQIMAFIVIAVLAFFLASWLGYRFIAPLQLLVQGFRRLAAGEHKVQLVSQFRLKEYRYVLEQFNQTSLQLDQLAEHREQLQQQQQLVELGEISRGLVHALRNPIHTMALALEQLPQASAEQQQLQKLVEHKMQHINRTLTALLTLSCEGVDRSQAVNLNILLHDIALEFSAQPVRLNLTLPEQLKLHGAEAELRSIFHAVISNAVEASAAGSEVQISLRSLQNSVLLEVVDQGSGLDPAIAEQLFQPHISNKAEGAGMGLYLCQRLLHRYYQGKVTLENTVEGGCIARIELCHIEGETT
jgi:signal transduction histidine kinase